MMRNTLCSRLPSVFRLLKHPDTRVFSFNFTTESTKPPLTEKKPSQIRRFYENKNVFITGGTGFVGNVIVEKLLRSCPGIKKIYLAVRPQKGKEPADRIAEMFSGPLFARLAHEMPGFAQKVTFISADLGLLECGMSPEDQELIRQEINVIFHTAANVRFNMDFRTAIFNNTRSVREFIKMAHQMNNLEAFVHVSTALSNALRGTTGEKLYSTPLSGNAAINLAEGADNELLTKLTPVIVQSPFTTYALSKCLGEDIIREMGKNLPIAVFRPSMVVSTAEAPIRGWINNPYFPTGLAVQVYKGMLRTLHINDALSVEMVPVDYVANAIIACAWDLATKEMKPVETVKTVARQTVDTVDSSAMTQKPSVGLERKDGGSSILVYNYVSSNQNRISWKDFFEKTLTVQRMFPLKSAVWCPAFTCKKNKVNFLVSNFFLQVLPAVIADSYLTLVGKEPRFVKNNRLLNELSILADIGFRKTLNCEDNHWMRLWEKLNQTDRENFYFDLRNLKWDQFLSDYVLGIRKYLLHETPDTVLEGQKKRKRFLAVQYTIIMATAVSSVSTLYMFI